MSLEGNARASSVLRGKIKHIPNVNEIINQAIVVGVSAPSSGPALWFNTDPNGASDDVAVLSLRDDESGSEVQAVVGNEIYGVDNITANGEATNENYDFTVL